MANETDGGGGGGGVVFPLRTDLAQVLDTMSPEEIENSLGVLVSSDDWKESHNSEANLILRVHQKRTCWGFKAKHDYECFAVRPGSGEWVGVDKLELSIARGRDGALYTHVSNSPTRYLNKTDDIYYTGNACDWSSVRAKCTVGGITWETPLSKID